MLSTAKTLKNGKFFRVFCYFFAKTGNFPMERKILILCCLFPIFEQKQDFNLYVTYIQ